MTPQECIRQFIDQKLQPLMVNAVRRTIAEIDAAFIDWPKSKAAAVEAYKAFSVGDVRMLIREIDRLEQALVLHTKIVSRKLTAAKKIKKRK